MFDILKFYILRKLIERYILFFKGGLVMVLMLDVNINRFILFLMSLFLIIFVKIIISSLRYIFEFSFLKMDNVINLENVCSIWYV